MFSIVVSVITVLQKMFIQKINIYFSAQLALTNFKTRHKRSQ